MTIGIHDSDGHKFPNYALMKISAWHKAHRDSVDWWNPMQDFDMVYSSKVFTFTPENLYLPDNTIKGGTGYGRMNELSESVDGMFPDYTIYPDCNHAIGFLTRGCIRNCPWCIVPKKEGSIRPYRTWQDIKRPDSRDIVFMDNNVLASDFGIEQMVTMIGKDIRIDFNQGMDARLITPEIADIISRLKWIRFIRMSCDTDQMFNQVERAVYRLEDKGVKPYRIFVYVLIRDVEKDKHRVYMLRDMGVDVFAQPYMDYTNNPNVDRKAKDFARYVNKKEIFKSIRDFDAYRAVRT